MRIPESGILILYLHFTLNFEVKKIYYINNI